VFTKVCRHGLRFVQIYIRNHDTHTRIGGGPRDALSDTRARACDHCYLSC
jgi:hypothetical protein